MATRILAFRSRHWPVSTVVPPTCTANAPSSEMRSSRREGFTRPPLPRSERPCRPEAAEIRHVEAREPPPRRRVATWTRSTCRFSAQSYTWATFPTYAHLPRFAAILSAVSLCPGSGAQTVDGSDLLVGQLNARAGGVGFDPLPTHGLGDHHEPV